MLKAIFNFINCYLFNFHDWTNDLEKRGGKPLEGLDTPEKIKSAFINNCKMYCKHCEKPSKLNKRLEGL